MHTYMQRQNQQVNRRHIKITYFLTAPEPERGGLPTGSVTSEKELSPHLHFLQARMWIAARLSKAPFTFLCALPKFVEYIDMALHEGLGL